MRRGHPVRKEIKNNSDCAPLAQIQRHSGEVLPSLVVLRWTLADALWDAYEYVFVQTRYHDVSQCMDKADRFIVVKVENQV